MKSYTDNLSTIKFTLPLNEEAIGVCITISADEITLVNKHDTDKLKVDGRSWLTQTILIQINTFNSKHLD